MIDLPAWLMSLAAAIYPGLTPPPAYVYDGYIEGNFTYAAAVAPGRITTIAVREGDIVGKGDLLYALDDRAHLAALHTAQAQLAKAQAELENLSTGSRDAETEVVRASLQQAQVGLASAQTRLARSEALLTRGAISQAAVDDQRSAVEAGLAQVAQLEAQLAVAELPARMAQRVAAEATVEAARAQVDLAQSNLQDLTVLAAVAGQVEKLFFDVGEIATSGAPVVSVLQPDAKTALFFVPQAERADLHPGDVVGVSCDGCADGITARITRLASKPQYTPPILYTREARGRLVYRVEAEVLDLEGRASGVLPGQPVTVDASSAVGE